MEQAKLSNNNDDHSKVTVSDDGYATLAAQQADGSLSLSVLVGGVTCAACIQKIESTLAKEQDVTNARLNFSTRRLALNWDGDPANANHYVHLIEDLGYEVQPYDPEVEKQLSKEEERFLLLCLGVAGFAMGNIMLLSIGVWITTSETMGVAMRDFIHWIAAAIALPTILFAGRPFFRSALSVLSKGHTNMDVPISIALILTCAMSLYEVINSGEHVYFDSAVMLMFFLLIGRYLDFRARKQARSSATDLLSSFQGFATVLENGVPKKHLIRDIKEGMIVSIAAGEKFPLDGSIMTGETEIDTSLVTGETIPREAIKGDMVFAGTLNISAPVTIKVTKPAEDSLLADIIRLMEKAGQGQADYVRLADQAARLYTPVVHSVAALAFLGWLLIGGLVWQEALMIAITVLIITCPCALGLAVPVVQVLAISKLMKNGILVKAGDALERLAHIDTAFFDKTGTLTYGRPELDGDYNPKDLQLAASLAANSAHPLSKAITQSYDGKGLKFTNIKEHPGKGLEGIYQGKTIKLGSRKWCGDQKAPASDKSELWLKIADQDPVVFTFTDHLRQDAKDLIAAFKHDDILTVMISGDQKAIAENIAEKLGLNDVYAEQTPPQKYKVLEGIKAEGHKVLMVGDGLNDAPVLAAADISIAPGSAIDMAQNAADIIVMGENIKPVHTAYETAKTTQKLVKQNFKLAVIYNIIAIPIALAGFVTPMIAALCMSGSSLIVIANAFRLKWQS